MSPKEEVDRVLIRFNRIDIGQLFPSETGEDYLRGKWTERWNMAIAVVHMIELMDDVNLAGHLASCLDYVTKFQNQVDDFAAKPLAYKKDHKEEIDKRLTERFDLIVLSLGHFLPERNAWDQNKCNDRNALLAQKAVLEQQVRQAASDRDAAIAQRDGVVEALNNRITNEVSEKEQLKSELELSRKALVSQQLSHAKGTFSANANSAATAAKWAGGFAGGLMAVLVILSLIFYFVQVDAYSAELFWSRMGLRAFVLAAVAATAYVMIQITRAYLQIREMNRHRTEIANSFEAIVGGASPENRVRILLLMVNGLVDFGDSGLVPKDKKSTGSFPVNELVKLVENIRHN